MRKIFDFFVGQIVLFFFCACIIGTFYLICSYPNKEGIIAVYSNEIMFKNYQITVDLNTGCKEIDDIFILGVKDIIENRVCLSANSARDVIILLSIILLIVMNIIVFVSNIIFAFFTFIKKINYEKILKEKYDVSDDTLYELPIYEPILANAILTKSYQYETTVFRLKYYYRSIGILNKFDKVKEEIDFDDNILTKLEQYVFNSKSSEISAPIKNLFKSHQREIERERKIFKNMIKDELVKKGFYDENIVQRKINKFLNTLEKGTKEGLSKEEVTEIVKAIVFVFVLVLLMNFSAITLLATIIFGGWVIYKYCKIHLTLEGEIERAKINFLINHLKIKNELSEKEKYFLIMLTR